MKVPERSFDTVHAEPGPRPLWVGLFGPSGGGKTWSALELATGIKAVLGGKIHLIDTESGRGLHYADVFDYEYTAFPPPHGSLDYLAVIKHAVEQKGARIVIVDSFSHEHEGEGGLIEFHEAEHQRMGGEESKKMLAWAKPKQARKQLLREMLRMKDVVFILCFRADESSKPVKDENGKMKVLQMGFMPIAGKPFVYEATVCALLMPGANGVPTWNPENVGERLMRKLPEQFKKLFDETKGKPMSADHGRKIAEWAKGGVKAGSTATSTKNISARAGACESALKKAVSKVSLLDTWSRAKALRDELASSDPTLLNQLQLTFEAREGELSEV